MNEIVLYQPENQAFRIEVRIEDGTVWLTQAQMIELFNSSKQNISLHINNIYKERELEKDSTVKEYLTVQNEGLRKVKRSISFYNLDVIISVGYRVKSVRGTQFRIWANKIIKEYLLKGHVIHHRIDSIERKINEHEKKFDLLLNTSLPAQEGIFFDGQIFDAWQFVSQLIKDADHNIILIDNYIDESVLMMLTKRKPGVKATIFSSNITKQFQTDLNKHNQQYPATDLKHFSKSHDRFLIIDKKEVYHIGASLKDLGKRWFAFSKINLDANELIAKLESLNL
jgi:hypothetical protein